jgi:hypothetical protein
LLVDYEDGEEEEEEEGKLKINKHNAIFTNGTCVESAIVAEMC